MEATVSHLLMIQRNINSKQKIQKQNYIYYFQVISKDFTIDNMKKTGIKGSVKVFYIDYNAIDTSDILDIHRYLMKET